MAASATARASSWWMASAASAATTSLATTAFPRNSSMTSVNCKANPHDLPAAFRQCYAERALRVAPGVALPADSPSPDRPAPPRHEDRVCHLLPLPGVLPGLSRASGLRALSPRRHHAAHSVSFNLADPYRASRNGPRARHHHPAPRPGRPLRQAPPDRPLDPPHLALRLRHRRSGLHNALPPGVVGVPLVGQASACQSERSSDFFLPVLQMPRRGAPESPLTPRS